MKIKQLFLSVLGMLMISGVVAAQSIDGLWTTIDDATGKKRAIIRLHESGNQVSGQIVKVFPQPGDTGICSKCPGNFKNKPIQGLGIVWGLKKQGNNEWVGGHILDPKNGKVYRVKMTLEGNRLQVRGYVGFSALGRTQVWVR